MHSMPFFLLFYEKKFKLGCRKGLLLAVHAFQWGEMSVLVIAKSTKKLRPRGRCF